MIARRSRQCTDRRQMHNPEALRHGHRGNVPTELLTPDEMASADRETIAAGTPGIVLMERAGRAVADIVRRIWDGGRIVVLTGPGNNGGDGWVAARLLRDAGYPVVVGAVGHRDQLSGDAAAAASRFSGEVGSAESMHFDRSGLVVDALYGAGVRLPLKAAASKIIEQVNDSGAAILAVDLPSGIEGASGTCDPTAIRADATVTFHRLKPGHVLMPGRFYCGRISLVDIGLSPGVSTEVRPAVLLNRPSIWHAALPAPTLGGHKYNRGHAVVVTGTAHATGAARLAAEAALRVGAGLVTLASPMEAVSANAAHVTAIMVREANGPAGLAALLGDARLNAVVVGPGLGRGERTSKMVETALAGERAVVVDADGLTSFSKEPARLFAAIGASAGATVLTPHDGEFALLFPTMRAASRLHRARAAAKASGAVILLKGADTIVASPDGRAMIADNAPPYLATAGAGDVLAGLAGGLLAQGMPAFEAASAAVWIHGEAANLKGPGLISEDLAGRVPDVLSRLSWGASE